MIVNVAPKRGFTPQYELLQELYEEYKDTGFVILGFPANNFNGQEVTRNFQKLLIDGKGNLVDVVMPKGSPQSEVIPNWLTKN